MAEAVSLAHAARIHVLAGALDRQHFEVHVAGSGAFDNCFAPLDFIAHRLPSISPNAFMARLEAGQPVYAGSELVDYIRNDLALIDAVQPDVVVSDFRLSLGVSARVAGIPLVAICNGHWSPYATARARFAPELPITRRLGYRLADPLFRLVWPLVSRSQVAEANRLRRTHGLRPYASLQQYYCDGDITLYADTPRLTPLGALPPSHRFIGPILWSPSNPLPPWWESIENQPKPLVYITLGSTGAIGLLPMIVDVCVAEGLGCLVATAGRGRSAACRPDVYSADYLPGSKAAAVASLVICNGGSATAYQALSSGTPVVGICSNLDQVLTMQGVERVGAGDFMRAGEATPQRLRHTIRGLLTDPSASSKATEIQREFRAFDLASCFEAALAGLPASPAITDTDLAPCQPTWVDNS